MLVAAGALKMIPAKLVFDASLKEFSPTTFGLLPKELPFET
jgi:hypothetical protein